MVDKANPQSMRAAIYARVSSDQQAQQGTIDSQVVALRQRVQADGLTLEDELCFLDDGYSGSTLVRPALERLRDVAWARGLPTALCSFAGSPGSQVCVAGAAGRGVATRRSRTHLSEPHDRRQPGGRLALTDAGHDRRIRTRQDHGT